MNFLSFTWGALSNGGGAHWLSRILWQLNEASDVLLGPH